jgi:hypothetical protein
MTLDTRHSQPHATCWGSAEHVHSSTDTLIFKHWSVYLDLGCLDGWCAAGLRHLMLHQPHRERRVLQVVVVPQET